MARQQGSYDGLAASARTVGVINSMLEHSPVMSSHTLKHESSLPTSQPAGAARAHRGCTSMMSDELVVTTRCAESVGPAGTFQAHGSALITRRSHLLCLGLVADIEAFAIAALNQVMIISA